MTGYRISDVADRSGFSAATLRYYEEIGLLPPPGRSAAGYRVTTSGPSGASRSWPGPRSWA